MVKSYCVVIPMLNEQAGAEACVRAISGAIARTEPRGRLILVDDGSTDQTPAILERLRAEFSTLIVERHAKNRGYGAAIRTGIGAAAVHGFEYVLFMDADLTNDPKYIPSFLTKMNEGIDYIKATRYSLGGGMSGVPWLRAELSRVGNWVARIAYGLPLADLTNGFRAAKVSLLSRLPLREDGFVILMEELYYVAALEPTYAEVPYILTSRGPGMGSSRSLIRRIILPYLKYTLLSIFGRPGVSNISEARSLQ